MRATANADCRSMTRSAASRVAAVAFMLGSLFFTYVMTVTGGLVALHRWSILQPIVTVDPQLRDL